MSWVATGRSFLGCPTKKTMTSHFAAWKSASTRIPTHFVPRNVSPIHGQAMTLNGGGKLRSMMTMGRQGVVFQTNNHSRYHNPTVTPAISSMMTTSHFDRSRSNNNVSVSSSADYSRNADARSIHHNNTIGTVRWYGSFCPAAPSYLSSSLSLLPRSTGSLHNTNISHNYRLGSPSSQSIRGFASKKHKYILKHAKGFRGRAKSCFTLAIRRVHRSWQNAYRGRKMKRRLWRRLWIQRIGAAVRQYSFRYSNFMHVLPKVGVKLNRKVLSEMAMREPFGFKSVVDLVATRADSRTYYGDLVPPQPSVHSLLQQYEQEQQQLQQTSAAGETETKQEMKA